MSKRRIGVLLSLAFIGLVTGCEKGSQPTTGETPPAPPGATTGSTATSSTTGTTTAAAGGKKYRIAFIPKNTGNPYFDAVRAGIDKAGAELGYEVTEVAPAKADATAQISFIQDQAQAGANAIIITPDDPAAPATALKEVMGKGVKVITVDADLTGHEDSRDAGVLPTDSKATAQNLVQMTSDLIGGKGDFAILSATTDAPNQNLWIKYMNDTLKDPKYKDLKLVATVYGNDEAQKSQQEAEALLTKYPNLKCIVAPTSVGIRAAAQVVESHQAAGKIQVTGLGMPSEMRRYVKDGTVKKFALWDPGAMGYLAGQIAVGLLDKKFKAEPNVGFKAGSIGDHKFGPKTLVIAGPPLVFDKTNIDNYKF